MMDSDVHDGDASGDADGDAGVDCGDGAAFAAADDGDF